MMISKCVCSFVGCYFSSSHLHLTKEHTEGNDHLLYSHNKVSLPYQSTEPHRCCLTCHLIKNKNIISICFLAQRLAVKGICLKVFLWDQLTAIFILRYSPQAFPLRAFQGKTALTDMHQWLQSYADDTCKGENGWQGQRASANTAKINLRESNIEKLRSV